MPITGIDLVVNRSDLSDARIVETEFPDADGLDDGRCLLKVDTFALTANNISYGVSADQLGYWDFFPTGHVGYGRIPVWGYADVVASNAAGLEQGDRLYGYLPMSTHLMIEPSKVTPFMVTDGAAHRQERAPFYNQYAFTKTDPVYRPEHESLTSLFRPLFATSFLLEDYHRSEDYFGAGTVILSSASSKTSMALADLLQNKKPESLSVVGLTSPGNREFVDSLGCYDQVVNYDALETLPVSSAAFVDMAGDADVLSRIHHHFGGELKSSCRVGLTHWQSAATEYEGLPGPRSRFFFAPTHAERRLEAWGAEGFQTRLNERWSAFVGKTGDWITVVQGHGPAETLDRYIKTLNGNIRPSEGQILSLWDAG